MIRYVTDHLLKVEMAVKIHPTDTEPYTWTRAVKANK